MVSNLGCQYDVTLSVTFCDLSTCGDMPSLQTNWFELRELHAKLNRKRTCTFNGHGTYFLAIKMRRRPSSSDCGFSLLEGIVVTAVIMIVGAMAIFGFGSALRNAK